MRKKCSYCGKLITDDKTYCNTECENKHDKFEKYSSKRTRLFVITMAIMIVMIFVGMTLTVVNSQLGVVFIVLAAVGLFISLIIFPFATPETVKLLGVKKSILIIRVLSLIMILWILIPMFLKKWN